MEHYVQAVSLRWYNACAWYAVVLSAGLVQRGARVTVIGDADTPAVTRAADEYGLDTLCGPSFEEKGPGAMLARIRLYREYALSNSVSAVNAHTGTDHLLWSIALRGTNIPLIRTSGNQIPPKNHPMARFLITRKTAGIVVSCRTIQQFYADRFAISPEHIPVINGGISDSFLAPPFDRRAARKALGIPDDGILFGILARYSPDKGHRYFFDAAGQVAQRCPDAKFLVAGWEAQLSEHDMRSMAEDAGIADRTFFTGKHADTRELISALDVGVIASVRSETICRIAMEYMAMGVPVVCTDTNVIPEVVRHNESGLVVAAGDATAMAGAMNELHNSPQKRLDMGRRGRDIIEREYTLDTFAAQTLAAYKSLTK